jgi:hypothetical protein
MSSTHTVTENNKVDLHITNGSNQGGISFGNSGSISSGSNGFMLSITKGKPIEKDNPQKVSSETKTDEKNKFSIMNHSSTLFKIS